MKIGYEGNPFANPAGDGLQVYNRQLLRHLFKIFPENEYYLFFKSLRQKFDDVEILSELPGLNKVITRIPTLGNEGLNLRVFFDFILPLNLRQKNIDIFHGLKHLVPASNKAKIITSFHDLFSMVIPETFSDAANKINVQWFKKAVARSNTIIASSQATKNDILRFFNFAEDKIEVIHLAAGSEFRRIENEETLESIKTRYGINYNFILSSRGISERKNNERLIRAYSLLKKSRKIEHKLLFFGGGSQNKYSLGLLISQLNLEDDIKIIEFVPENDLIGLYNLADLFVYPSLYEGFGIPIVEAMRCGTPVITSNTSSMPEVAGNAALLVSPYNIDQIAETIYSALNNEQLRNELKAKGLVRAESFSWEKTARVTGELYKKVMAS